MSEIKIEGQAEQSEPQSIGKPEGVFVGGDQMLKTAVAQAFDIDSNEMSKYSEKINTLLDYAKTQTDSLTPANIKWVIRNLEMKLGSPPLSEKRINYVTRYAYLAQEKAKISKEMNTYNPFGEEE